MTLMIGTIRLSKPAAAGLFLALATVTATAGGGASRWDGDAHSEARLIAAGRHKDSGTLRAGIEVRLKPGWITYWRYPGDAGIPPRFGFDGSENVKSVSVSWPAPVRLVKGGALSIGYAGHVVFPVAVTPADPALPVTLRLRLDYGVCEKLCVPAEARLELTLDGTPSMHDTALAAAEARVPQPAKLGAADAIAVRSVRSEAAHPRPRVVVDVAAPEGAAVDLFAEGPTADWALPLPEPVADAPKGLRRFVFALDGIPSGASPRGAVLKLTATAGDRAIEVPVRLD